MELQLILILCLAAFAAGFVDAIVGGGGLIQTPVALIVLPELAVATIIGSLKIPAFSGTSFAAFQYAKKVTFDKRLLLLMLIVAGSSAFVGSYFLTMTRNDFMKPLLFFVLLLLAFYIYFKKDFGLQPSKDIPWNRKLLIGVLLSLVIGFYDGFIGPGTGSFLIFVLIVFLGFDFLNASAHAKMLNLGTNLGSIILFTAKNKIIWTIAIPMAFSNAAGGYVGSKLAIKKGNTFIRKFFLFVVLLLLLRFGYDVFLKA